MLNTKIKVAFLTLLHRSYITNNFLIITTQGAITRELLSLLH
jgi:hypothetical protein